MFYAFALATLIVGLIAGILFQRSGMCFIGGYRDFYLFRDTHLVKGVIAFFLGAVIGYVILSLTGAIFAKDTFPWVSYKGMLPMPGSMIPAKDLATAILVAIIGAFGVGFFSVLSGGCPLRNHVMAGEGNKSAIAYVIGFWIGIPITYMIIHFLLLT
ncbi:MAG: YeeE/YedE thiosulfate transporter family protein [Candidatus Bathyarchaeia archaeon]